MDARTTISDLSHRYQLAMVLHLVVELNIGQRLAAGESLDDIARSRGVKPGALRSATQALAATSGIFDVTGTELTDVGLALLDPASPRCVTAMVEHEARQQSLWHTLDDVLRSSEAVAGQQDIEMAVDEERLTTLLKAMRAMNPELINEIAALDTWASRSHLLDVAGGHGAFLAAILEGNSNLTGLVLDQPTARRECQATLRSAGVAERSGFAVCDLHSDDSLGAWTADAVLLCRCLHNFSPSTIESILASVQAVLRRAGGGVCVVVERHLDHAGARLVPRESALFSAYMAVNCAGGHVPRSDWMTTSMQALGRVHRVEFGRLHSGFICEVS